MTRIRKERAGSDSFGNTWPEDGAVVDIDPEHVASLLAIPDGGFSEVTPAAEEKPDEPEDPEPSEDPDKTAEPEPEPEEEKELSEINPEAPSGEPESKTPTKKTAARKTAARKPVEEG